MQIMHSHFPLKWKQFYLSESCIQQHNIHKLLYSVHYIEIKEEKLKHNFTHMLLDTGTSVVIVMIEDNTNCLPLHRTIADG